jgi:hypothetical protein
MYQTQARPDVSRKLVLLQQQPVEKEKFSALTDQDVCHVTHIREPKEEIPSVSQTNVLPTKSSLG